MKKFLFLFLSMAVASSAIAGVTVKKDQKAFALSSNRMEKVTKAPMANQVNSAKFELKAPKYTPQQREVLPMATQRVLDRVAPSLRAAVTTTPTGTARTYKRSGGVFLAPNAAFSSLTYGDQGGTVEAVVDGSTIWFKNFMYDPNGYLTTYFADYGGNSEYWIQGTISGDKVTIPLAQEMINIGSSYTLRLGWGTMYTSSGSITMYLNTTATEATFTINGDVLTLDGSQLTSNYLGVGFVAYWDDDDTWANVANYTTELTNLENAPDAPVMYDDDTVLAMNGELVQYYRYGGAIYRISTSSGVSLELGLQKGYGYVFYDEDGETVYMRDPVYGWNNSGYWIKGTKSGDQLTFPLGQYIYWDENFLGLKTSWGTFVQGSGYTDDPTVTEVSFTVTDQVITMNNAGVSDDDSTYVGMSLLLDSAYLEPGWFGCLDFFTQFWVVPTVPTDVNVVPGSTTANVSWTDADDSRWNVRYREYVDPSTIDYYFQDFEDSTATINGYDLDGDGNWWTFWEADDGNNYIGSASYINGTGALTPDNWVLTPEIKLDEVVRFKAWGIDANYPAEVFQVYLFVGDTANVTDPSSDFVAISEKFTATGEAVEYTANIPEEYQGQQGYIAIRHYDVTDQYWLAIDDIYVGPADGGAAWIYVNDIEDLQTVLAGLTPQTEYEVQVQAVNNGGPSVWTESVRFWTTAETPTGLRGDVDLDGEVGVSDITALLDAIVTGNWEGRSVDNADCDLDGEPGINDVTALLNYLLTGNW